MNAAEHIFDDADAHVNAEPLRSGAASIAPARILIAAPPLPQRAVWIAHLSALGHAVTVVEDHETARRELARENCRVALIDIAFENGTGMRLARHLDRCRSRTRMILLTAESSFAVAVEALRLGAVDVLALPADAESMRYAVECALDRYRKEDDQAQRIERLRDMCRKLNAAKQESHKQIEVLCQDLANAYEDIADQMSEVAMTAEFRTLLAQELDLEDLLRTTLEYLLTRTGPTNAAVFLPDSEDAFSLGAYVNYDCPREDAEVLLEHLSTVVCPVMLEEQEILQFTDADELADWLGEDAAVLYGSDVIAFSCFDGPNCLAVMVLFRDQKTPFDQSLAPTIDALRAIFARQVSSVIAVHHRAGPQWPAEPAEDGWEVDDDFGFAA